MSKAAPFGSVKDAAAAMPLCLVGGYDALSHTTLQDLQFLAEHELDLHGEGEIELSGQDMSAIVKYRNRLRHTINAFRFDALKQK